MPKAIKKKFARAVNAEMANRMIKEATKKRRQIEVDLDIHMGYDEVIEAVARLQAPEKCVICMQIMRTLDPCYTLAMFNQIIQGEVTDLLLDDEVDDEEL